MYILNNNDNEETDSSSPLFVKKEPLEKSQKMVFALKHGISCWKAKVRLRRGFLNVYCFQPKIDPDFDGWFSKASFFNPYKSPHFDFLIGKIPSTHKLCPASLLGIRGEFAQNSKWGGKKGVGQTPQRGGEIFQKYAWWKNHFSYPVLDTCACMITNITEVVFKLCKIQFQKVLKLWLHF